MKANADDVLTKLSQYRNETTDEYITVAEAKQQLADGLVAALPYRRLYGIRTKYSRLEIQHFNEAIDQAEAAIREYFK